LYNETSWREREKNANLNELKIENNKKEKDHQRKIFYELFAEVDAADKGK